MKKYAMVVLANNMTHLRLMLENLPDQSGLDIIIGTDLRVDNYNNQRIRELCAELGTEAKLVDDVTIRTWLWGYWGLHEGDLPLEFMRQYKMGMNVMLQPYVLKYLGYERAIFLDEDIIITKDLTPLVEKYKWAYYYFRVSANTNSEWWDFARCSRDYWISHHINGGQRIYSKEQMDLYLTMLLEFFSQGHFYNRWMEYKTTGKGKTYGFYQDENFETAFLIRGGYFNNYLSQDQIARVIFSYKNGLPKAEVLNKSYILHYCCSSGKDEIIQELWEKGIIK